ncbi:MAG: polyphosphate kinase 1 [Actinobacteria bacterium]|nr:polyphosphate kinase 1 [Actinomycetota bacterium]
MFICTVSGVKSHFVNRELSWLEFNRRVLSLAKESSTPLLERLKFVAIFSSNLDEFFQVRVGALHDQEEARVAVRSIDGLTATEQLGFIRTQVVALSTERDAVLRQLFEEMRNVGIQLCKHDELTATEQEYLDDYFDRRILPMLTPLAVDPAHPFPYISNLALSVGVIVSDPDTREERFARVKVPTTLDRFVDIGHQRFVTLETIIVHRLKSLFPGMNVSTGQVFRVTRNTDLSIDAEEAEDLLTAVELELRTRRFGNPVRLEAERGIDSRVLELVLEELELDPIDVYFTDLLIDTENLWELHKIQNPSLHDQPWVSVTAGRLAVAEETGQSIFSVIRHRELMVHHPYESFASSAEEFIRQAAADPTVRAIKATLYRTSANSPIARNLIAAAERGVQVVALVELTARFDEQTNLNWAKELERAGAHVVYGMVGLKTHAKCLLVVREESDGLRRYAHIGTGNYNSSTARMYEDIGLFTCDDAITTDVADLFNYLTGFSHSPDFQFLLTAPRDLRTRFLELIQKEASFGEEGRIQMKMNSLVDPRIITALEEAAAKGVKIDLLIRGICSLDLSQCENQNIRVRSVLGRFLEHSRIYVFGHGAENDLPAYYIGSADIMPRNLDLRVEVLVPIRHPKHQSWLAKVLDIMWSDDVVRFEIDANGKWHRAGPADFTFEHDAQGQLMKWATDLQLSQGTPSDFDLDESPRRMSPAPLYSGVKEWFRDRFSSESEHS